MANPPLKGIRVISLGTGAAIPDFALILAQLGADVIKIESLSNPDFMRVVHGGDMNANGMFNEANRNKRSFGVDLKKERGKKLVEELIKMSDVVGENFRHGAMDELGLGYETVRKIKPDIIYLSSYGFGKGGPYSDYRAFGPTITAASGLLSLWAHPGDTYPTGANTTIPDHLASKMGVLVVLSALDYRRRTGKGQFIDIAQIEVAANLIGEAYLDYTVNGRVQKPAGNRNPYAAPHGCYPCKGDDQWCAISVFSDDEWQNFCSAIGNPVWSSDPKFANTQGRRENVDELDKLIAEWTINREPAEVMNTLQAAGVAAGLVQRGVDWANDPQLQHLNAMIEVDHPIVGKRLYPNAPFKISDMVFPSSTPAPLFGQHTEEICQEMLNMSQDEIERLKKEEVLEVQVD